MLWVRGDVLFFEVARWKSGFYTLLARYYRTGDTNISFLHVSDPFASSKQNAAYHVKTWNVVTYHARLTVQPVRH
jgi:hypothetical protein